MVEYFFDFKQKKYTRRKGINSFKLANRHFNDSTGKHKYAVRFFILMWCSLKTKTFQTHFCKKQRLPLVI